MNSGSDSENVESFESMGGIALEKNAEEITENTTDEFTNTEKMIIGLSLLGRGFQLIFLVQKPVHKLVWFKN